MSERFVGCCERKVERNWFGDLVEKGRSYMIKDTENKIPVMHFLYEKDMWIVYELLKSKHMVFE